MAQTQHRKKSLLAASNTHHCFKAHCPCPMSLRHPTWYTNGLCERHFFEMDLLPNDDDDVDLNLNKKSKLVSKEKDMSSINHPRQPLRDDIRKTREIFDGRQWRIIEQKIDHGLETINTNDLDSKITTNTIEDDLLQIFQFIKNYQTIKDELKAINETK